MQPQEEARKIIAGIVQHQKNAADRLSNVDSQIADVKKAVKLLGEQTAPSAPVTGSDSLTRHFVRPDGSIRMHAEKAIVHTASGERAVMAEGILDSDPVCEWQKDLQKLVAQRTLMRLCQSPELRHTPKTDAKIHQHMAKAPAPLQAGVQRVFNDAAGTGSEWIPDQYLPDLFQAFELPSRLRGLFPSVEVDKNVVLIPRLDRGGRPYIKGQLTVDDPLAKYTASTVSTAQASITIKGLATLYNIDDSAAEDALISGGLLPMLARQISADLEDAFEDCMINGDTTAVHQDTLATWNIRGRWGAAGLGGASDHRRSWDGLRREAIARGTTVNQATSLTYDEFLTLRYTLGELGAGSVNCIVSPEVLVKYILGMDNVATVDKFGPQAAVLTGQIAAIAGVPILVSRFIGADMTAGGVYTGAGALSGMLLYNTDSYYVYNRRGITVEQDKAIASGAIQLVSTMRAVMATPDAAATKNVSYGFNL